MDGASKAGEANSGSESDQVNEAETQGMDNEEQAATEMVTDEADHEQEVQLVFCGELLC